MTYDTETAQRVRRLLSGRPDIEETRMVGGGLGFLVGGHLCCGVSSQGLVVRVGRAAAFVVVEPDDHRGNDLLRS